MVVNALEEKNQVLMENNQILLENNRLLLENLQRKKIEVSNLSKFPPNRNHNNGKASCFHVNSSSSLVEAPPTVIQPNSIQLNSEPQPNNKKVGEEDLSEVDLNDLTLNKPTEQNNSNNNSSGNKPTANDKGTWQIVQNKKNKQKNMHRNRPSPTVETNNQISVLRTAQIIKLEWVFLSGLDLDTKPEDIMEFLNQFQLDKGCQCSKMKTKKDHLYSSFKLGVPGDKKSLIMNADLWPCGTIINHFQNLQSLKYQTSSHQ